MPRIPTIFGVKVWGVKVCISAKYHKHSSRNECTPIDFLTDFGPWFLRSSFDVLSPKEKTSETIKRTKFDSELNFWSTETCRVSIWLIFFRRIRWWDRIREIPKPRVTFRDFRVEQKFWRHTVTSSMTPSTQMVLIPHIWTMENPNLQSEFNYLEKWRSCKFMSNCLLWPNYCDNYCHHHICYRWWPIQWMYTENWKVYSLMCAYEAVKLNMIIEGKHFKLTWWPRYLTYVLAKLYT